MEITLKQYNEILTACYEKAGINKELCEFTQGLGCYTYAELREIIKTERLFYLLTEQEIHNKKAVAADVEFTKRLLSK